jgi:hypothetical protein
MADKDLAEFVIHLALESDGVAAFKAALASNGAIFPSAFADRLHEMVRLVAVPGFVHVLHFQIQVQRLKPKRIAMEQQVKQVPAGQKCVVNIPRIFVSESFFYQPSVFKLPKSPRIPADLRRPSQVSTLPLSTASAVRILDLSPSGLALANTRPMSIDEEASRGDGAGIAGLRSAASPERARQGRSPSPHRSSGDRDGRNSGGRDARGGRGQGYRDSDAGWFMRKVLDLGLISLTCSADWRRPGQDRREAEGSYTHAPPPPGLKMPPAPELQDPELYISAIF